MDEKLKTTIDKIKQLAEQNPEFDQAMRKLFGQTASASFHSNCNERIAHIEKYLGLDYYTDSVPTTIDYSYIKEEDIRDQLISDNREMLRFRYGTRFHKIIFEEFCRYAQLQAEMLINYFYYKKNSTIEEIIAHIKKHNTNAIISNKTTFASISFAVKLWAFCNEFKLKKTKTTFDYVRDLRNYQSHRNPKKQSFSFENYQYQLQEWGIVLNADGSFNYMKTKQNDSALEIYKLKVMNQPEFKLYEYEVWFTKQPYDEIITNLKLISDTVKKNLPQ